MKTVIAKKEADSQTLAEELKTSKSFLVFEYLGLNAKDITSLRRNLHKAGAKMYVAKNNIFNRAMKLAGVDKISDIAGPNALIVSQGDEVAPFKEISEIAKKHTFIKFKGGILDNQFIGPDSLSQIASIPGREGLYSMLLSCLQAPIRNFLYGIKAVGESKPQ
ncbi:MAG: 50S ribosomal protein L10 [Mycoplasmoidaceae bacterium]|nr:50S ribosomal protein L10 [Mycoplasmoidaceae bacterium]